MMTRPLLFCVSILPFAMCAADASPAAQPGAEQYARVVLAEPALAGYWRFDGELKDSKGESHARPQAGTPQFAEGPGGGKALVLADGRFVTMGETPKLDLPETTVELWLKPDFKPPAAYNPCIIAKRAHGHHRQTRFSLHVWNDYSCIALWDGRSVARYEPPHGPLGKGQWYYLAITFAGPTARLYVDGVPCRLIEGGGSLNTGQRGRPLSVGSSTPGGQELLDCSIDEVAIYGRALSETDVARHVDAMGYRQRREQLAAAIQQRARREKKLRAERDAQRERRRAELFSDPALLARGGPTIYRDEHLEAIGLTLGGIGSGSIQTGGRAELAVWQIFNNHRHAAVPHSFFAVRVKPSGGKPVLKALQTAGVGPFAAIKQLTFRGEYPFGWYTFDDPELPVKIRLEAFNPLVPLDVRSSSIPCAIFNLTAENPTDRPVEVAFLAAQQNAVGYLADKPILERSYPGYGGNRNRVLRDAAATVLHLTSEKPRDAPGAGDMALLTLGDAATACASWTSLDELAKGFIAEGTLAGPEQAGPSAAGTTIDGAIAASMKLAPGEKRSVPFLLTWHFPNARHGGSGWGGSGNQYANHWPNALAVARYLQDNLDKLTHETRLYHDALYESNLPYWLVDRIGSQVAVLRSKTCFWTQDGYFGGWEGCARGQGCCHGNCNHVWHYAQAHARLFPTIARTMRGQEFRFQSADGAIPHRQPKSFPAFDGQCGAVLNSYREHLMCPDRKWLDEHWPSVRRAMEYIITTWDKDADGVLAGAQWNTLDGALAGSSSWLGTMYLAALAAAEKMALLQNEPQTAKRYARIRAAGCKKQDETLFNGEYYVQIPESQPHEDYGSGCHIDQLLGQWWAHQLDLVPEDAGWLYPPDRVRTALGSLLKYNFRGNFQGLRQSPRKFVDDADPGLQMITWPLGPKPTKVIRYGDEVMTGFEYPAAAAMVQAGMVRQGFAVVRAVSIRYDGRRRTKLTAADTASWGYSGNPFGDDECGKFYARAMSVWSMLLACQGFVYDGPAGLIGFRPVWKPEDHVSFFTAAEGWGVFRQRRGSARQTERIEVRYGRLRLSSLVFELPEAVEAKQVTVRLGGDELPTKWARQGRQLRIALARPAVIEAGTTLHVEIDTP